MSGSGAPQGRLARCPTVPRPRPRVRSRDAAGDVWHVALEGLPGSGVLYGFRVQGEGGWDTGYRWARVLGGWGRPRGGKAAAGPRLQRFAAAWGARRRPRRRRAPRAAPCPTRPPARPRRWDAARVLLDPRAPLVAGRKAWRQRDELERFALDVSAAVLLLTAQCSFGDQICAFWAVVL